MQEKQTSQIRRGKGIDTFPRVYIDLLARSNSSEICDGTTAEENVRIRRDKHLSEHKGEDYMVMNKSMREWRST